MSRRKKRYILYYDTEYGIGKKVDHIEYQSREEANIAIIEYEIIDRICGNHNEYFVMEV